MKHPFIESDPLHLLEQIGCCITCRNKLEIAPTQLIGELLRQLVDTDSDSERLTQGLICNNCNVLFPVWNEIFDFLPEHVIPISQNRHIQGNFHLQEAEKIKNSVQKWYNNYGWQKNSQGLYNDTALFSQVDASPHALYELSSHLRVMDYFFMGGNVFLDAGSGPIVHPEYLAYSWFHQFRVCVDFSIVALREAQKKLGNHGIYVLADICCLPFLEDMFDGIICGYLIQHLPASQQKKAVWELFRVLSPDHYLVIFNDVKRNRIFRSLSYHLSHFIVNCKNKLLRKSGACCETLSEEATVQSIPNPLFWMDRELRWWKRILKDLPGETWIRTNRLLTKEEFERYIGKHPLLARYLRILEDGAGKLLVPFSPCLTIRIKKIQNSGEVGKQ